MNDKTQLKILEEIFIRENRPIQIKELVDLFFVYGGQTKGKTIERSIVSLMNGNSIDNYFNKTYKNNRCIFIKDGKSCWKYIGENILSELKDFNGSFEERSEYIESLHRRKRTNPTLRKYIMNSFPDKCQLCGSETFTKKDNHLYFEIHHIKPLSEEGEDKYENLSKICANCHREAHFGIEKEKILEKLILSTQKNLKELKNE